MIRPSLVWRFISEGFVLETPFPSDSEHRGIAARTVVQPDGDVLNQVHRALLLPRLRPVFRAHRRQLIVRLGEFERITMRLELFFALVVALPAAGGTIWHLGSPQLVVAHGWLTALNALPQGRILCRRSKVFATAFRIGVCCVGAALAGICLWQSARPAASYLLLLLSAVLLPLRCWQQPLMAALFRHLVIRSGAAHERSASA